MTDPTPGVPDHAAPALETEGLSPKMIAASAASTAVGIVVALLNALQADASLLGDLPPWLQFVLITAIPPLLAGFAAYQAKPGNVSVTR